MIETVVSWVKGDSWSMVHGIRDGLLLLIIISLAVILFAWYYVVIYHQGITELYSSMSCSELKDMMINSAEGLGPIFRGHYTERCI